MGKARDGSECYTRQNKAGGSYVTCEGSQQARQRFAGELRGLLSVGDKPKPKVDWSRSDTVRGRSRRAAKARRLTTRPEGRIETGSINPGSVITDFDMSSFVQERPGVVGMTTNMSGIELATYDALMGMGEDVRTGIQAAIAEREKDAPILKISKSNPNVGRYDVEFSSGKIDTERGYYVKLRDKPLTEGEFVKWIHAGQSIQSENRKKMKELFNEVKSQGFKLYFVLETDQEVMFDSNVGNPEIDFSAYQYNEPAQELKVVALDKKGKIGNPYMFWNRGTYSRPLDSRDFDQTGIASTYMGQKILMNEHFFSFFKPTDIGARIKFNPQQFNIKDYIS